MAASFDFNTFASSIELWVRCPQCGRKMYLNVVPPMANLYEDTHSKSSNSDFVEDVCEHCGFVYEISLNNGICGGDGMIDNIPEENLLDYKEQFEEDDWVDIPDSVFSDFLDPHVRDIAITLDKIEVLDEDAQVILYRSLYVGVIGAFEAYLSDTIISRIMRNDEYKIKFVKNSQKMNSTKFCLSEFYDVQNEIDKLVLDRLKEIIYHNLAVVSKLYEAVLDVKFPQYDELARCITIRHDIVHRNGKDKSGNPVKIMKEDVQQLLQNVSDFIKDIESQIYQNEHPEEMKQLDKTLDEIFGEDNPSQKSDNL